ncbi:hypothetical protein, partial [Burkholderia cenocepacia]|uniref:hypothetical protein n=1 Tax=Burkholderia cenocepacia TaxID=95486 RepID=UPI001955A339
FHGRGGEAAAFHYAQEDSDAIEVHTNWLRVQPARILPLSVLPLHFHVSCPDYSVRCNTAFRFGR